MGGALSREEDTVNRFVVGTMIALLGLCAWTSARAQVFYAFPRASVVKRGEYAVGPLLAIGDNELVRFAGYGRLNLVDYLDMGAEVLVDNVSGDFRGGAGVDFKYQLFPDNSEIPFDLSTNAGLGFTSGASLTTINVPFGGIMSTPYALDSGASLVPYVGVYLRYLYSSLDTAAGDVTDNELDVEARIGLAYGIKPERQVFVTLHVGTDTALFVGFNFDLK